jgi:hypothetical protein
MGSNDQEFWYWIKRAQPAYVYHCSYDDYRRGVRMPFPFQPEWIMEALGVATYDEAKQYEVRETPTAVQLIEQTVTPQGQAARKVTLFDRRQLAVGRFQVTGHVLQDANGKDIAYATVQDVQSDPVTRAVLPRNIRFVWPAEKVEMKMKLDGLRVGAINPQRAADLFTRRNLANLPSFDLARGPDTPGEAVQRTGGPGQ